jgi:integrase
MSLYRPAGSKIYWMDFHYTGQRIRESTKMPSITRAKEVQAKRKQELRDGTAGIRKREAPKLFSVAAAEFQEAKKAKWSPGMSTIAAGAMKHLAPIFGKKLVVDIEASDIARYQKARLADGASGRSVNIEIGCLRAVMKRHGLWARLQPNIEMLPERDDAGHALSAEEETALLSECGNSRSRILLPFVTLAIETAARYGTIRRLQWRNVDLENRALTFGKDKTRSGSGRTIPLTSRALETLRFWAHSFHDRQPDHFVFPSERIGGSGTDEAFGFTGARVYENDPTKPTGSIKKSWEGARARTRLHCPACKSGRIAQETKPATGYACAACGWKAAELPPGLAAVRFHDLRHTGVSRMIAARIPLPIIAKIVGWSAGTLAKMAARYGHFSIEEMRSAMDSIGRSPIEISAGYPQKSPKSGDSKEGQIQ